MSQISRPTRPRLRSAHQPARDRRGLPALRACMATDRALTRFGEVHGRMVNVAGRLTSLARPGTAVVDAEGAAALRPDG